MRRATCVSLWLAISAAGGGGAQTPKAAEWRQFRGPGGLGVSDAKGLPLTWSAEKNIVWKTELLWSCEVPNKHNNNPSAVTHNGVVCCIVSGPARSALAVRAGGRGDVTNSHVLWKVKKGSNVSSPVYHDGYLYFTDDILGIFYCLDAKTGETVYEERRAPAAREIYASPVLAEGKLFYVSRRRGTFVLSAKPQFELLAQNDLGDPSIFNASPVVSGGQWLLRSDRCLYCIGQK